jgi:mono/diheme cytochrome c family protein
LFSLKGTMGPAPPLAASAVAPSTDPGALGLPAGAPDLAHGKQIYNRICVACHGPDGQGSHGEGAPLKPTLSTAAVYMTATLGRRAMPAFRGTLTPLELRDVAGYITGELVKPPSQTASPP